MEFKYRPSSAFRLARMSRLSTTFIEVLSLVSLALASAMTVLWSERPKGGNDCGVS